MTPWKVGVKVNGISSVPESMIYILGMEKSDVSAEKQLLYDELFHVIKSLVIKVARP